MMGLSNSRETLIKEFIQTGVFRVIDVIDFKNNSQYMKYFKSGSSVRRQPLLLTKMNDLFLRRRICEFLFDSVDSNNLSPAMYYNDRLLPLKNIWEKAPEYYAFPYQVFLTSENDMVRLVNNQIGGLKAFLHTFYAYCRRLDCSNNPFESDEWYLEDFHLSFDRNCAFRLNKLKFGGFYNETNKILVKHFIEYELTNTGLSINQIYSDLIKLRIVLNTVGRAYTSWDFDDAKCCAEKLQIRYSNKPTLTAAMIVFFKFTDFLLLHDYLKDNPIKHFKTMARIGSGYKYNPRSIDNFIISQIYQALDKLNDPVAKLGFLILHSVGMRCSEMLSLKRNCVEICGENAFLNYYSQKMKKDVCNVIPSALALMINEYQEDLPPGEYLFPSKIKRGTPVTYTRFSNSFNRFLEENNITNPDGTLFRFSSHSMRHQMAVRMREKNVPLKYIQEQLHHSNVDMTLAYVEYLDRTKIQKMTVYLNANGDKVDFRLERKEETENYVDYIRQKINAQILPNGVCARPIVLGTCPHSNRCLDCPEYRTSRKDLNVHRQHLKRIDQYLAIAEENHWLPQIENNQHIKAKLERIITVLEETSDGIDAD